VASATAPFVTGGLDPRTAPVKAVSTGWSSTSSLNWSPGLGSLTPALNTTDRPGVVPPTVIGVLPLLWNCPSPVGGAGSAGMEVLKSAAVSGFPPNDVQALARPVWSSVRARHV